MGSRVPASTGELKKRLKAILDANLCCAGVADKYGSVIASAGEGAPFNLFAGVSAQLASSLAALGEEAGIGPPVQVTARLKDASLLLVTRDKRYNVIGVARHDAESAMRRLEALTEELMRQ